MRLFIGITIPPDRAIRALLEELERAARSQPDLLVVPADNLHVTLRFLGEVSPERVPAIVSAMEAALADEGCFHLQIGEAGSFTNALWLRASSPGLARMAERLDDPLSHIGFDPERRPYRPHVTLARLRPGSPFDVPSWLDSLAMREPLSLIVDRVHLYHSVPVPGGVRYKPVHTLRLRRSSVL